MSSRKKRFKMIPEQFTENPSTGQLESKFIITKKDLKTVEPLTHNQEQFFNLYRKNHLAFLLHGVAGTGKTFIALYNAFKEILEDGEYQRVIIVRSAVPSREIGHLPGNEKDKSAVYTQPYMDICKELFPRFGEKAYNKLKEQGKIDFMITSFVRGITLDNAIVIVDECQNMNDMELNSIMTRVGQNTKIIFCGDFRQTDLNRKHDVSGLKKLMTIVNHMPAFRTVEFGIDDIVRSELVKQYIVARMHCEDLDLAS